MARKGRPHKQTAALPADLRPRIDRAVNEGRFQQALELAKQLYKYEPTPDNKQLVLKTYLGRARQLRTGNYTRDAVNVLQFALQLVGDDPTWLEQFAQEFAACGATAQATALMAKIPPDSPARLKVLAQSADNAVAQGPAGKASLPTDLQADFDRILQAAAHIDTGKDEQAKEVLQGIGLRSPFLEWKLMLRGLSAYYQGDDSRALENWQRLSAERLPARVVAPLRFRIDPAYQAAQPPQAQAALQKQADALLSSPLTMRLRAVQAALRDADTLPRAFRLAEEVLPALRQQAPALAARLATVFFWAVIHDGQPEDVPRYQRVFGAPPDDPGLARLKALAFEHHGNLEAAHQQWQNFERSVAATPASWPGEQATRVRALIWRHMGLNAAALPDFNDPRLPPFLRNHPDRPKPLKPTAEECFKKSLELVPDQLETHEDLVQCYLDQEKPRKAEQAARVLLEHFPDHVPTLETLANLRSEAQDYAEAMALLERAIRHNPLERRLRQKLSTTHLFQARAHAEAGRFDDARAEFHEALATDPSGESSAVYCKMAACEFKAGDSGKAEALLDKALSVVGSRLSVVYSMLIEVIRLKLPGKLKTRFNKEFNALLAQPADAVSAVHIAQTAADHQQAGVTYHGQKTHEKKVLDYLRKALAIELSEAQIDAICESLLALRAHKLLREYAMLGQRRFRKNPYFCFWEMESHILLGPHRCPVWRVRYLIDEVRRLAADLPPGPRKDTLLETTKRREEMISVLSPFGGIDFSRFDEMFEQMFDDDEDGDDRDG